MDESTHKPLAFVIEDDRNLADIFTQALIVAGYETETIMDGRTALERLAISAPTLVLLDLQLPTVSGDEILRQIRADARLANTRVFLATANDRMAEHLRADSDLILLKPISFSQLRALAERFHPGA